MTPKPPPGFEIIEPNTVAALPQPPLGFEIIQDGPKDYGIDWSGPDADVRAKVRALPADQQEDALTQWADAKIGREGTGGSATRMFNRGLPILGSVLDEGVAALKSGFSSDVDYDEALALERAKDRKASEDTGWAGTALSLAGGLASAPFTPVARGATVLGDIAKGAATGAGYGAVHGFGAGEGGLENRLSSGGTGAGYGLALGGGISAALQGAKAIAPSVSAGVNQLRARLPQSVTRSGAEDVADKVIAGRLRRSGQSSDSVADDLAAGQHSARLDSKSEAVLPEMLADTSDDMQRLAGSVYRTGGEASETIKPVLERRQRGPENPYAPRSDETPQGQIERIVDDFDRALLVKSSKGARATGKDLEAAQKAKADELYTKARNASENFDLEDTLTAWHLKAQQYQGPFRDRLVGALNLFREPPGSFTRFGANTVTRFDNAKRIVDDMIENAKRQGENNLARELTGLKNDLLAKVHEGGKNKFYQQAREEFGTAAENREAIELGRKAFREDSEVSVDTYRSLTTAQKKLFRIGLRDALRLTLATKKPGDNATIPLQQRRVRELLSEVIPQSKGKNAEFADRPERFGDLMRREERMTQTKNAVLGNSATAQRVADDAEFASDALSKIITGGRSVANVALEAVGAGLQKVFGYRRDVAAAIARRLIETDPATRSQILASIKAQESPQAFSEFAEGVGRLAPSGASFSATPAEKSDRVQPVGQGRNEIRGGAGTDTLSDVARMSDTAATAAWDAETPASRASASVDKAKADMAWLREHPGEARDAFFSSIVDLGGLTSDISRGAGTGEVADAIARNQEQAPGAATAGHFTPLAIPGLISNAVKETYNYATTPNEPPLPAQKTRDEFFSERRKTRETLEEAQARAEREFAASPGYAATIAKGYVTKAKEALREAGERAKQAWKEGQKSKASEEAEIEADYQAYLQERNHLLEAENAKGFAERNPWFKPAVAFGSLAAGALGYRGINKLSSKGDTLIADVAKARKAGDAQKIAEATAALERWQTTLPIKQSATVGLASTVPTDIRGIGDAVDKYGLPLQYYDAEGNPQPVLAQQRAAENLQPAHFIADSLPAIISGLTGAGIGAKLAKGAPVEKARAITTTNAGAIERAADLEVANAAATKRLLQGRQDVQTYRQDAAELKRLRGPQNPSGATTPEVPQGSSPATPSQTALPPPKKAQAATTAEQKNEFWDSVETTLEKGGLDALTPAAFPQIPRGMVAARIEKIKSIFKDTKLPPEQIAAVIRSMRKNDAWKLGVAGVAVGEARREQ